MTSGSGDRPTEEGCHGGGVFTFFPGNRLMFDLAIECTAITEKIGKVLAFCFRRAFVVAKRITIRFIFLRFQGSVHHEVHIVN